MDTFQALSFSLMRSSYLLTPSNSLFLVVGIGMIDNVPVDLRIKVPSGEYPEITNAWAGLDFDQDTKNGKVKKSYDETLGRVSSTKSAGFHNF